MHKPPGVFLFGLTGGVASGKSTVAKRLHDRGVTVIDADDLARRVVEPGRPALTEIVAAFGPSVVPDGALDRSTLGNIVFGDPAARARLNAIVHPRVAALLAEELTALTPAPGQIRLVCYEVPLLFENGLDAWLRPTVLVACDEETQVERAMARNGWTREHALSRIAAQMPLAEKRRRADFVIENDATLDALNAATDIVLARVVNLSQPTSPPAS